MTATPGDLIALERSLWQRDSRFDPILMQARFAPDFFEVGRSGRRYSRDEMILPADQAEDIPATLHDLAVQPLSLDLFQVIYLSELRYDSGTEWAWRSSIWDRSTGAWQLRFHQGTPTQERPSDHASG